ncbi:MAG: isoprenyl transferase [Coriobacteriia bacterium]|nr:isoprenyl transferase [Coriobacteriia bacterium]
MLHDLDAEQIPRHVAIIMDGNGRWAKARGKPRLFGHKAGAAMVRETIASAIDLDIKYLTIYSFSTENWTRPEDEVSGIMALFVEVLSRELQNLQEQNVRVRIIGDLAPLPEKTRAAFENCVSETSCNTGLTLIVAVNYGARADIVHAVQAIAHEVQDGALQPADVSPEIFAAHLSTAGIPDPDLLIRTSGELRVSNFLLYEIAYTEIVVTDTLWPDFDHDEFFACVAEYQARARRYGGV